MKNAWVLTAAAVATLVLSHAASATTAAVAPTGGPPTSSITVSGTGFDASALIDVFFDTGEIALATSNASGTVSATFPIPASAQPGSHWLTLSERRTAAAAQASFLVLTAWPQSGFGPSKRSYNPYENTIDPTNVARLTPLWSQPLDGFGNSKPPIAYADVIYVRDANQVVRAFLATGKLLWKATTPFETIPDALTPAAGNGYVYFADNNGNVIAYKYLCRTDGGTCAPTWTTNIGAAIAGGLTLNGALLYAPAADGYVHVLNAVTGAPGTSIPVSTSPLTTWIAFRADGGGYVGHGTGLKVTPTNTGASIDVTYPAAVSFPAVGADWGYVTEVSATLQQAQAGWAAALSGPGCNPPPAFANNIVYAAGCGSLGAFEAGTGALVWSASIGGGAQGDGLSYANGVLYGCFDYNLAAFSGAYGGRLWSGGGCSWPPIVLNGVLYSAEAILEAYTLTGAQATVAVKRPDPRLLRATLQ